MVPGTSGGTYILYNKIIRPFFLKHQERIDSHIGKAKDAIGKGKL
jgi:hypothetical protein